MSKIEILKKGLYLSCNPKEWVKAITKLEPLVMWELIILMILQVVVWFISFSNNKFAFAPDTSVIGILSLVAGVTTILSVVIESGGNITSFFWGAVNNVAYLIVSFNSHLYGEVYLYMYFFVTEFIGIYFWTKNNTTKHVEDESEVQVRELSVKDWLKLTILILIGWLILGIFLLHVPFITPQLDPHPWIDALSVVVQVVGQVLWVMRYGISQFLLWAIGNATEVILWTVNFNPIMIILFIGCVVNSFVGMYIWHKKYLEQLKREAE